MGINGVRLKNANFAGKGQKSNMKKSFLLFAALCCAVLAGAQTQPDNEIWYTSIDGNIVEPNDPYVFGSNILSNSYENGKGVIRLARALETIEVEAFKDCIKLLTVSIPESVKSIEDFAFQSCSYLSSVTIPSAVTDICDGAFSYCPNLSSLTFASVSKLKTIGDKAFRGTNLAVIEIPESVMEIGEYAFADCSGLKMVMANWTETFRIPAISSNVFDGHTLSDISLIVPAKTELLYNSADVWRSLSVNDQSYCKISYTTNDGEAIFLRQPDAFGVTVLSHKFSNGNGSIIFEGPVRGIGAKAFMDCFNMTSVNIPSSVTIIGDYAFDSCMELISIDIPEFVTHIGDKAFNNCRKLSTLNFAPGSRLEKIGDYAFSNTGIKSIEIPESVTGIGDNVFNSCRYLKLLTASWTEAFKIPVLGENAFAGLSLSNTYLAVPAGTEQLYREANVWNSLSVNDISKFRISYTINGSTPVPVGSPDGFGAKIISNTCENGQGEILFDGPVTSIGSMAFFDCENITSVTIPGTVISIGDCAFNGCSAITSISIPSSVRTIEDDAFRYCSSVSCLNFAPGSQLETIGSYAFCDTEISSVDIPESVTGIGEHAFAECSNLKFVKANWTEASKIPEISASVFYDLTLSDIRLLVPTETELLYEAADVWKSFSINRQSDYLMLYTSSDGKIVTPRDINSIDAEIFDNRYEYGQGTILFATPVTCIGEEAFSGCSSLTSVTIPESVTIIGDYAFNTCGLTSVTIPDSVTSIGECAFYNCSAMTSVTIPNTVTSIGEGAFSRCTSLPVENNLRYAGDRYLVEAADKTCSSYSIKEGTRWIEFMAFGDCTNMTGIDIPSSVTEIYSKVFANCNRLNSILIPSSITGIEILAFCDCSSLEMVLCAGTTPPNLDNRVFEGCSNLTSIYVPSVEDYIADANWKTFESIIRPIDSYKTDIIARIEEGLSGTSGLTDAEIAFVDSCLNIIGALSDIETVFSAGNGAVAVITLRNIKNNAIADIEAAVAAVANLTAEDLEAVAGLETVINAAWNSSETVEAKSEAMAIISLRESKNTVIAEIESAMAPVSNLTADDLAAIEDCKAAINSAVKETAVVAAKNAALAIIGLQKAKNDAIAELYAVMDGETGSAYLKDLVSDEMAAINNAAETGEIQTSLATALDKLNGILPIYKTIKAEANGTLGTKAYGPAVRVTDQNDNPIILYNPKKVEFIKVEEE